MGNSLFGCNKIGEDKTLAAFLALKLNAAGGHATTNKSSAGEVPAAG
jgi:hypothetical protein